MAGLRLDADLAACYGVSVKAFNQAVKRNRETSRREWSGRRYAPFAFTELGVAMLSSVLTSPTAIRVNIQIMRAFVVLRRVLESQRGLAEKLDELQAKYD